MTSFWKVNQYLSKLV